MKPISMLAAAIVLFAACSNAARSTEDGAGAGLADESPTTNPWLDALDLTIMGFVAARVYHDFPSLEEKRWSKFEAFLDPSIEPTQIDSVRVLGPNEYVFEFENAPIADNSSGYVHNERVPALWYHGMHEGEIEAGQYTLTITFQDGSQLTRTRELVPNDAMLDFYLRQREAMRYTPSEETTRALDTHLRWTTLRELGGPDAYYIGWVSPGTDVAVHGDAARGDLIFFEALLNPAAGLNRSSLHVGTLFDPLPAGPQTWHPEILDANVLDAIDQIIFPPASHFTAE